jgi:hypothetical protein
LEQVLMERESFARAKSRHDDMPASQPAAIHEEDPSPGIVDEITHDFSEIHAKPQAKIKSGTPGQG